MQGLRAIAVGVVLLYHAGAPFLPGGFVGVDVFFVISGFLITGLLLRESAGNGRISLGGFYARRIRRILPAASIVLILVVIGTVTILPRTRWEDTGWQVFGSATYIVNWILAGSANYLNAEVAASPVQHFWTLAVEEQFYIVWPLLLVGLLYLARPRSKRGRGRSATRVDPSRIRLFVSVGVLLITVPSLLWSIYYTAAAPAPAYFVTTTRLWELGIGATVAVFATSLARLPKAAGYVVGWTGLIAILGASVFYTSSTPFPGYQALLPTLGAAAIIIGGMSGRDSNGVGWILGLRPMRWVGDISYSLYLWHWPLIVFATYLFVELEFWQGLIVVAVAFVPAYLSYKFVEVKFRDWKYVSESNSRALQLGVIMLLVTVMAAFLVIAQPKPVDTSAPVDVYTPPGATAEVKLYGAELLKTDASVGAAVDTVTGGFTPSALTASDDNPSVYKDGCHVEQNETEARSCVYGDPQASFTVAMVGDSHTAQWVPAMQVLAKQNGWRIETYTKSSCPLADVPVGTYTGSDVTYDNCATWNDNVLAKLAADKPNLLIVTNLDHSTVVDGKSTTGDEQIQSLGDGYHRSWQEVNDMGIPVVAIVDTPFMGINVPECVSVNTTSLTACAKPRSDALLDHGKSEAIGAGGLADVSVIDLNDMICPQDSCAAVVGNVLVYRDESHLTATYSKSLASSLLEKLVGTGRVPTPSTPSPAPTAVQG